MDKLLKKMILEHTSHQMRQVKMTMDYHNQIKERFILKTTDQEVHHKKVTHQDSDTIPQNTGGLAQTGIIWMKTIQILPPLSDLKDLYKTQLRELLMQDLPKLI